MSQIDCGTARAQIPELVHGAIPASGSEALRAHVHACGGCRDELELVRLLHATRPDPRPELEGRLLRSVRFERRAVHRPWWGITAAAVGALALGIGLSSDPQLDVAAPAFALEVSEDWPWTVEDGLVAGAPVLDDLSEDALARLLEDLGGQQGGV